MNFHSIATIKVLRLIFLISAAIPQKIVFRTDSKERDRKYMFVTTSVEQKRNLQEGILINKPNPKDYLFKLDPKPNHDLMEKERKGI